MTARALSFPVAIVADGRPAQLRARVSLDGVPAARQAAHLADMARSIPYNSVSKAISAFGMMNGAREDVPPPFVQGREVAIPLPLSTVGEPWRAGVLLNLADFSLNEPDAELRLADDVVLIAPPLGGLTPAAAFAAVDAQLASARAAMTRRLPPGFKPDQYESGWPEEADEYLFEVRLGLSRAPAGPEIARIAALLDDLELIVAWMGFATEGTAEDWTERGRMVFAGGVELSGATITWSAQRPPTDFSPALLMLEQALSASFGITVARWDVEIEPAD